MADVGPEDADHGRLGPDQVTDVRVWDDCALGDPQTDPEQLRIDDPNQDCTPDEKPDPTPGSHRKPRRLLAQVPRLTAEIDIHAAMFGNHNLVFRNVRLHGGYALIEQTREPYPLHAYNRTIVSIVSAFYPRMKAGFRAGIYADSAPPIVDLIDVHLEGLDVEVHVGPFNNRDGTIGYRFAARVEGVDVDAGQTPNNDAFLHMDARDPLVQKFYVRLGLHGQHGKVRILDNGPRDAFRIGSTDLAHWGTGRKARYEIEVSDVALRRLALLPVDWARGNFVANTLDIDATVHALPCKRAPDGDTTAPHGADLHVTGGPRDFWDHPYDGQWDFHIDTEDIGDVVRTCIKSTVGGEHLGGHIALSGPFVADPRVDLDLHGLDVDIPLASHVEPLRLSLAKFRGFIDLVNEQGAIDETEADVGGGGTAAGKAMVSATFGLTPLNATATLEISKAIDIGRFLPATFSSSVGKFLSGKLKLGGDIDEGFEVSDFDVALGLSPRDRTAELRGGRIFAKNDFDHIEFQRIRFTGGKTNATIKSGAIEYVDGTYIYRNLDIKDIDSPDFGLWLQRFHLPPIATSAGGGEIVLNGPVKSPTINVRTTLEGVPCIGNIKIEDSVVKDGVADAKFSSTGLGGAVTGTGLVDIKSKPPVIQALHLSGNKLDASKLCGLVNHAVGTIDSADLDLRGTIDKDRAAIDWAPLAKMAVSAQHLTVLGDDYTGVALCLNRPDSDDSRCRPQTSQVTASDVAACTDAKKRGGACAVVKADRAHGGRLEATIANVPAIKATRTTAAVPAHLGGALVLDDVPMAVLDPYAGRGMLGGLFSAVLHLQGTLTANRIAPQATGAINLLRGWIDQAFTGDSQLQVDPIDLGKMRGLLVRGSMLGGELGIVATIGSEAPYPLDVSISGRRVELDQFVDLAKMLGFSEPVQMWGSGTVSLHVELMPVTGVRAPEAWVELTELEGIYDHRARDGRKAPLRFVFVPPSDSQLALSLRVTPSTVESCMSQSERTERAPGVPGPARDASRHRRDPR